ncbi:hypothetical protein NEMBOFW57_007805 [Staphylotrichum longicolle]|uniref:Uncharacterized protein n=1 Tax=Staphylotrichum longicolle TaxID=669026 RepID=A0AAD4HVE9_9PEZI|nr:hypothetical protein NEMBOFW57_007805 [Staphylotrichum longicolle]
MPGDTITAAALEFVPQNKRPESNKLRNSDAKTVKIWFAANNGIDEEAWDALLWVRERIKRNQAEDDDTSEDRLAQEIGERLITLASCPDQSECCKQLLKDTRPGAHRINTYAKKMRNAGKKVRKSLDSVQKPAGSGEDALRNETDRFQLVQRCYYAWFDEPYSRFLRGAQHQNAPTAMREFAHIVARLGAHRYAALKVAAGIKRLLCHKETRYLVEFDKLPRHSHVGVPLKSTVSLVTGGSEDKFESDPWKVIHRISQRYPQEESYLAGAYLAEEKRKGEGKAIYSFADEVRRWIKNRKGQLVTRYHAELQVASWFLASNAFFFKDDPYVACSKGACWFCHQYLKLLQTRRGDKLVEPSRHNETLPGVSFPPAMSDGAGERVQRMKDRMNEVVLQTIRDILREQIPEYSKHAQSTSAWMDEEDIRSVVRL